MSDTSKPTYEELLARLEAVEQRTAPVAGEVSPLRPFPVGERPNLPRDEDGVALEGEWDEHGLWQDKSAAHAKTGKQVYVDA